MLPRPKEETHTTNSAKERRGLITFPPRPSIHIHIHIHQIAGAKMEEKDV